MSFLDRNTRICLYGFFILVFCHMPLAVADSPVTDTSPTIAVRPTGIPFSDDTISSIANLLSPTVLERSLYPEANHFSARQIVTVLCGTPTSYYLNLLESRNDVSPADIDKPLGDRAYSISFPACLNIHIFSPKLTYTVKPGDSFSTIRQLFTGVPGRVESNSQFFHIPERVVVAGFLMPGETLSIPYATTPTLVPKPQAESLIESLGNTEVHQPVYDIVQQSVPESGKIVSFTHGQIASSPVDPSECGTNTVHPYSAQDAAGAFQYSLDRAQKGNLRAPFSVGVVVVDNGFFGAKENAPNAMPIFGEPQFREGLFDTTTFGPNLGPPIGLPPEMVYPLNYQNDLSPSGPLSGHGTHVTGLVLGGPDLMSERAGLFGATGPAWLQVLEINVGDGSDQVLPVSAEELSREISFLADSRIINLSISYDGSDPNMSGNFAFMSSSYEAQNRLAHHLYVVAAGNDGVNADDFPAVLGGVDYSTNVITVVALDPAGNIAKFSDFGPKVADVAAPGCNIASWIDDTSPPTPLSGTSQAAPLVSFDAALIRGLSNGSADDLKTRIIVSGDLLTPSDQQKVSGHVKINIVRSLFLFDDDVQYLPNHQVPQRLDEELGDVLGVGTLHCSDDEGDVDIRNILSYKSDGSNSYAYFKNAAGRLTICPLVYPTGGDKLVFQPTREAGQSYTSIASTGPVSIPMSAVRNLVMRMMTLPPQ